MNIVSVPDIEDEEWEDLAPDRETYFVEENEKKNEGPNLFSEE